MQMQLVDIYLAKKIFSKISYKGKFPFQQKSWLFHKMNLRRLFYKLYYLFMLNGEVIWRVSNSFLLKIP